MSFETAEMGLCATFAKLNAFVGVIYGVAMLIVAHSIPVALGIFLVVE